MQSELKNYEKLEVETWLNDFIENNKKYYKMDEAGIKEAAIDGFMAGVEASLGCINNLLDKIPKRPLSREEQIEECFLRR